MSNIVLVDLFQRYTNTFGVGVICVFDKIQINSVVISRKVEGNFYTVVIIKINGVDKNTDKVFSVCWIVYISAAKLFQPVYDTCPCMGRAERLFHLNGAG